MSLTPIHRHRVWTRWWPGIGVVILAMVAAGIFLVLRTSAPRSHYERGQQAAREGDSERVFREAAVLLKTPGEEAYGHLLRGTWFLQTDKLEAATREFQLAAENPETSVEAWTRCGEAFYRLHRFLDAEQALLQALEQNDADSDVHRWLASTYYDLGAMTLALEHLRIVGESNPADGRPYRLRGLIQKDFELFGEAIPEYEEALRRELLPTERAAVIVELAECLKHQLRYNEALKLLETADESARSYAIAAQCHADLGHSELALTAVDRALELDPKLRPAMLTKASILLESGRAEEAVPILENAAATYPQNFEVLFQLIKAWRLAGRSADADARMGKLAELEALIDQFSALNKQAFADVGNAELRFQLGSMALKLGEPKLAESWFEAAIAIDSGYAEAAEALTRLQASGE